MSDIKREWRDERDQDKQAIDEMAVSIHEGPEDEGRMSDPMYLWVAVRGRPAPQGSKLLGPHGQMRESSAYLPAWRAAVKRAVYERYKALEIEPKTLPLFRGPVVLKIKFYLNTGKRVDGPPDLDKLTRSTWDALTQARVWEDDGRVVRAELVKEQAAVAEAEGADIRVWTWGGAAWRGGARHGRAGLGGAWRGLAGLGGAGKAVIRS